MRADKAEWILKLDAVLNGAELCRLNRPDALSVQHSAISGSRGNSRKTRKCRPRNRKKRHLHGVQMSLSTCIDGVTGSVRRCAASRGTFFDELGLHGFFDLCVERGV